MAIYITVTVMATLQIYAMSLQRTKGLKIMSVSDIGKRMTNISQAREKFSTQPPKPPLR